MAKNGGWGVNLRGLVSLVGAFDDVEVAIEGDVVYAVGTDVHYAVYQEFGTSAIAARPAMRKATSTIERSLGAITMGADSEEEAVKRVALALEREWKQNIVDMDIIDTGNYLNSVRAQRVK